MAFRQSLGRKNRFVLTLQAYFDESGTHQGSPTVCVAGYISTPEQWEVFGDEWKCALDEWGLDGFHMTDFVGRVGPYSSWSDQDRRWRLARLITIINRHTIGSVGIAVPKESFDQIFPKATKRFIGGAYGLAASCCFLDCAKLIEGDFPSARIAYVFEIGAPLSGEVHKVFNWNYKDPAQRAALKLLSIKFEGKEFAPLQAADILAYELYRYFPVQAGLTDGPARIASMEMLKECKSTRWGRLSEDELFKWAEISTIATQYHTKGRRRG